MKKCVYILMIGVLVGLAWASSTYFVGKKDLVLQQQVGKQTVFEVENVEFYTVVSTPSTLPPDFLTKGER